MTDPYAACRKFVDAIEKSPRYEEWASNLRASGLSPWKLQDEIVTLNKQLCTNAALLEQLESPDFLRYLHGILGAY
jgi:hypothetical protein